MKQKLLNIFRLRAVMLVAMLCAAVSGAWATDFTLSSADAVNKDGITISFAKGGGSNAPAWYSAGLRLYANNTITISSTNTITSITFNWEKQGSKAFASATASVGDYSHPTNTGAGTWTGSETSVTFTIGTSGQLQLNTLSVTTSGGGTPSVQTVATPTFNPAAGAVTAGTEVTISSTTDGATIYYTTNGDEPTTSSTQGNTVTINAATTIKAIAVKEGMNDSEVATAAYTIKQLVSGYTIDFESDVDCYSDWDFSNIDNSNTVISAHGGNNYGANINASGNGVQTASVKTKEKIALPGTFTCYVSKASDNSKTSTWKIQVSADGETWTDVESKDAASMTKGTWEEFTADLSAYSNVYVRLLYDGNTAVRTVDDISITMRDANEKPTPLVTIDATGLTTTDLAGETNVSAGTISATVTHDEATISSPAVTWSSSETGVATIDANGAVTLIAAGTTTITANFAGNDDYKAASKDYELTVIDSKAPGTENNPYTVAQALAAEPSNGVYVQGIVCSVNSTSVTNNGQIYYSISADGTENGDKLNVYNGLGLNGEKFTSINDIQVGDEVVITGNLSTYNGANQLAANNHLVSLHRNVVQQDGIIDIADASVVFGNSYTIDTENDVLTDGELTITVTNPAIASVNGTTITPLAVGSTTISVSSAETAAYTAASDEFTLTVTAPEGKTTAAAGGFVKVTSTADITDGQYLIVYEGEESSFAFDGSLETLDAIGNTIAVTISEDKIAASDQTKAAAFTIDVTNGTIKSASGLYIGKTANSNGLDTNESTAYTNTFSIDESGNAVITASGNCILRYNSSQGQDRFRYYKSGQQAIQLYKLSEVNLTAKLSATTGYATYCSEYPLDFSDDSEFSAWEITNIEGSTITFNQIKGSVKGGTGVFLKGENGATITLTSTDSQNTLDNNLLEGTLAPIAVAANQYYGLSGKTFVKVNAGTVPAGKALLPANKVEATGNTKALTFVFNSADGIKTVETVSAEEAAEIFNIAGQRLQKAQRGLNIIGGRKVVIK